MGFIRCFNRFVADETSRIAIRDGVYGGKPLTADHLMTMSPLMQAASSLAVDRKELAAARRGFQRMVARMMPDRRKRQRFLRELRAGRKEREKEPEE